MERIPETGPPRVHVRSDPRPDQIQVAPSIEASFGDHTMITFNRNPDYVFKTNSKLRPYAGGGVAPLAAVISTLAIVAIAVTGPPVITVCENEKSALTPYRSPGGGRDSGPAPLALPLAQFRTFCYARSPRALRSASTSRSKTSARPITDPKPFRLDRPMAPSSG
jgi:hypothetical protein